MNIAKRQEKNPAYLRESEKIRENREKYGAKVHKFKAASWTHPNGHPRCFLCGQEESISPECNREPTPTEHLAFQAKLSAEFGTDEFIVSPDGELVKNHFDPKQARDPHTGEWVDVIPAGGLGRKVRRGVGSTKVAGKARAKKKTVAQRIVEPEEVDAETETTSARQRRLSAAADVFLEEHKNVAPGSPAPAPPKRKSRAKPKPPVAPAPESIDVTAASRARTGTLGDATHNPIKSPTRNQIAEAKRYIKDDVKTKDEAYAGLVLRLASRGRVQSPEMRAAAAEKYGRTTDDLYAIERGVYTSMFGASPEKAVDHHTIKDASPKARVEMKNAGATHATSDVAGTEWMYQDRDKNWHTVDEDGSVSSLSSDEAAAMAQELAQAWGDAARENMTAAEKKTMDKFKHRREVADMNMAEQRQLVKDEREFIASQMEKVGLDPSDPNQVRIFRGRLGVLGELQSEFIPKKRPNRKVVTLPAADADKKHYRGQKPTKGKDTVMDGGTPAKSSRQRRVQKNQQISKHGHPGEPGYELMHPNGRKTQWVKGQAGFDKAKGLGFKFVAHDDGRELTPRQAQKMISEGGKKVYGYIPGHEGGSMMAATARARRAAANAAKEASGAPKPKITRRRAKSADGRPAAGKWHEMTTSEMKTAKQMGLPVPAKYSNLWWNEDKNPARRVYVGTDENGKVQSKYSRQWDEIKAGQKFAKLKKLSDGQADLNKKLRKTELSSPVDAAISLMNITGMRVDSGRGAEGVFGVTSLEAQHVEINGSKVTFRFVGKGSKSVEFEVVDKDLARLMNKWTEGKTATEKVFPAIKYKGESADKATSLRLKELTGIEGVSNKDLRTKVATARALEKISEIEKQFMPPWSLAEAKRHRNEVGSHTAYYLGNTRQVALNKYIDPTVFAKWGF